MWKLLVTFPRACPRGRSSCCCLNPSLPTACCLQSLLNIIFTRSTQLSLRKVSSPQATAPNISGMESASQLLQVYMKQNTELHLSGAFLRSNIPPKITQFWAAINGPNRAFSKEGCYSILGCILFLE